MGCGGLREANRPEGEEMTDLIDRPDTAGDTSMVERRNRFLAIAVVVLGVVVVILGALMWSDRSGRSSMPAEVERVVDAYTSAIEAGDAEAWRATITDDFFNRRYIYGAGRHDLWEDWAYEETADPLAYRIEFYPPIEYEQTSDPFVVGDGPWFVAVHQRWPEVPRENANPVLFDGVATYVVVERDGVVKIASEYFTGTVSSLEN